MSSWYEWRNAPPADFAVLGDPISHSKSPLIQNAALRDLHRNENYVAIRVPKSEVADAFDRLTALGYRGLNATAPLKEEFYDLLHSHDAISKQIGAVNTIDVGNQHGRNTDAPGFAATLDPAALGAVAVVLGAGGSSRAVCAALAQSHYAIRIWNRTRDRAMRIPERLQIDAEILDEPDIAGAALIVNCTAGFEMADLGLDWDSASPMALAYDLMYGVETPFLAEARNFGLRTMDGARMLVEQGALALEGWIGVEPSRSAMLRALEDADNEDCPADTDVHSTSG